MSFVRCLWIKQVQKTVFISKDVLICIQGKLNYLSFQIVFSSVYVCVCSPAGVYIHSLSTGAQRDQMVSDVIGSCERLLWVLGTEPRSFAKAAFTLNRLTNSVFPN